MLTSFFRLVSLNSSVRFLTLSTIILCSGCSVLNIPQHEECKTRAYTRAVLADHLNSRFQTNAPVRLAVIPYSVPANLASGGSERPGLGNELAWQIHAELLQQGEIPIVEILNRQDWPGKKDEFFTGNFGAIDLARQAGYDLVLVGYVKPSSAIDSMTILSKLIEVDSRMTLYYGSTTVDTDRPDYDSIKARLGFIERTPSVLYTGNLASRASSCIADEITSTDPIY